MAVTFNPLSGGLNIFDRPTGGTVDANSWVRPSDWLAMPTVLETEQKIVGLLPVFNAPENYVSFACEDYYSEDYTVDWGDGTVENFPSGSRATHSYVYGDISSATESSRGYRQVLVTITPQAGQNLRNIDFGTTELNPGQRIHRSPWLDLIISMPQAYSDIDPVYPFTGCDLLERIQILNLGTANSLRRGVYGSVFKDMTALRYISIKNCSGVTDYTGLFDGCISLTNAVIQNSAATLTDSMFQGCNNLKVAPLFDTSSVTSMGYMFANCEGLLSVPLYDTSSVTNMQNMFENCYSLESVPLLDTGSVTNMSSMFKWAWRLKSVPLFNTANVTDFYYMFGYCHRLLGVPLFNVSSATSMEGMLYQCKSLVDVPLFSIPSNTNLNSMFSECLKLAEVPVLNLAGCDIAYMFYQCPSLSVVPALNISTSVNSTYAFDLMTNLRSLLVTGISENINITQCELSKDAIVTIFNNLTTVTPPRTINVSDNPGAASLTSADLLIATNKGWTVVN